MIPVEIVNITDEPDNPGGAINSGDLLITEIMYDPTALTDTYGEWFEIYNNTDHAVSLQHLVISKNATERHIITADITMTPRSYQVFARHETAVSGDKYVYGTAITLNNTGAVLSVSDYGTDGTDGAVICSVNYGGRRFSTVHQALQSVSVPDSLNAVEEPLGTSWCVSVFSI